MPGPRKSRLKPAVMSPAPWYGILVPHRLRPRRNFVVVTHPRSGSNYLRDALNGHPDVFDIGELFHANPLISVHPKEILGKDRLSLDDVDPLLDALAQRERIVAPGFSLFSRAQGHLLDYDAAARLVSRPDFHVIFLIRRNLLKAYVSLVRALKTGYWHVDTSGCLIEWKHSVPAPDAKRQPPGPIDIAEAQGWINETLAYLAHIEGAVKASGKDCHTVYYEDLCLQGQARSLFEVNGTLDFLRLRPLVAFEPRFARTADKSFYESIPNREEAVRALGFDLDDPVEPSRPA
jgi:LPS sulfotransferase NodH